MKSLVLFLTVAIAAAESTNAAAESTNAAAESTNAAAAPTATPAPVATPAPTTLDECRGQLDECRGQLADAKKATPAPVVKTPVAKKAPAPAKKVVAEPAGSQQSMCLSLPVERQTECLAILGQGIGVVGQTGLYTWGQVAIQKGLLGSVRTSARVKGLGVFETEASSAPVAPQPMPVFQPWAFVPAETDAATQAAAVTKPFHWSAWNAVPAAAGAAAVAWGVAYQQGEGTNTQGVAALASGVTAAAVSLLVTSLTE